MQSLIDLFVASAHAQASGAMPIAASFGLLGKLLILAVVAAGFLGVTFKAANSVGKVRPEAAIWVVVAGLILFVPLFAVFLEALTEGRVSFEEALSWLPFAAIGVGSVWYFRWGRRTAEQRQPAAPTAHRASPARTDAPAAKPAAPDTGVSRPAVAPQPSAPKRNSGIFISYRREDSSDTTGRIYDRLVGSFGRERVFKDVDAIPLGVDFRDYLGKRVGDCAVLIAVIGDRWQANDASGKSRLANADDFVRIEIEAALSRGIPVVPVLVRGAAIPAPDTLPQSLAPLAYRNGLMVRADPDFHRDMDRLIAGITEHVH